MNNKTSRIAIVCAIAINCTFMAGCDNQSNADKVKQLSNIEPTKITVNLDPKLAEECLKEQGQLKSQKKTNDLASIELARLSMAMKELSSKILDKTATKAEIDNYNKSIPSFNKMNEDNNKILVKFNKAVKDHNLKCGITPQKGNLKHEK